jgi:hypothetical protein
MSVSGPGISKSPSPLTTLSVIVFDYGEGISAPCKLFQFGKDVNSSSISTRPSYSVSSGMNTTRV